MEEVPPYLPFGSVFRVAMPVGEIIALAQQHIEVVCTQTMFRVNSAFELADMARQQSSATMRRATSNLELTMLTAHEELREKIDEQVQRSWRLAQAARGALSLSMNFFLFPFHLTVSLGAAVWAIIRRPSEIMDVAECARRENARRAEAKMD
ncbi:hypothetical protein T492DRAFT_1148309 [Pavlovales sp. CCMP2436]|nr:hypothetical protein T492DRAFT_1148309 [Pavlovales sp. CCMP2436]